LGETIKNPFSLREKYSLWGNRITARFAHRDPVGGGETIKNPFSLRENVVFF